MGLFNRESDADREAREEREMLERIEADVQRRRQNQSIEDTLGSPGDPLETIEYKLRLENKKVAKSMGFWGMLFGSDSTDSPDTEPERNQRRAERATKDSNAPKPEYKRDARKVVNRDTGLNDDGYMCKITYFDDGSVDYDRL